MANNEVYGWNGRLSVPCTDPALPTSGVPVRYGSLTGVAVTDEAADGNAALATTVDFSMNVWDVVVDDDGGGGIAVGDPIYYHDTGTGTGAVHLNNVATGMNAFFGIALEAVGANATTLINVLHIPIGATVAMGTGAITNGMLAADAVTSAKILDGTIVKADMSTELQGTVDGLGNVKCARFTFDPSATAGMRTIAAHGLGVTLPDKAIVIGGGMEILTTFADGVADAATIALMIQGANDLVTATAISSGTFWDAIKWKVIVPDAMAAAGVATPIKLTAAREVTATVGGVALTAGKLVGWLYYVIGA